MRRREFIALLCATWFVRTRDVHARPQEKTYRIGILSAQRRPSEPVLMQALAARGYVEGRNTFWMSRSAEGDYDRVPALASELIALNPDVIIAAGGAAAEALTRQTATTPIVLWEVGDPTGIGITNVARPGGNVTGVTELSTELSIKRLELLKETVPGAVRVAILWNASEQSMDLRARAVATTAPRLGISVIPLPVRSVEDIDSALATLVSNPVDAVMVVTDPMTSRKERATIDFLTDHRLPSMYEYPRAVRTGALLSYGPDFGDLAQIAADYVDRILKGAKPGDLPIQAPSRLYLRINSKTAGRLGISLPAEILLRADEVIE